MFALCNNIYDTESVVYKRVSNTGPLPGKLAAMNPERFIRDTANYWPL